MHRPEGCAGMAEAFAWGLFAGSSLVLGGAIAVRFTIPSRVLGLVMAFGAGVLISAVAYDLTQEAFETSHGAKDVALGLFAGAVVFYIGDEIIDRRGGASRKRSQGVEGPGLPIVLGIVLDGIPEAAVIGLGLVQGGDVAAAFVVAVFLANLPESIAATAGLKQGGWAGSRILGLWVLVAFVTGLAALLGYVLLEAASPSTVAFVLAFAGGAILTMLADTMMPEAFEHGGKLVGLVTTLGFGAAFGLTLLD